MSNSFIMLVVLCVLIAATPLFGQEVQPEGKVTPQSSASNKLTRHKLTEQLLLLKGTTTQLFMAEEFDAKSGAIIRASRNHGLRELVEKAGNDSAESAWIFLPKYELWIHSTAKVEEAKVSFDKSLSLFLLGHIKEIEFWHTHVDAEYDNYYSPRQILDFGPSLYFIPTFTDVANLMQNANMNPKNKIAMVIASSRGVLTARCPPLKWELENMYARKAFSDFTRLEFVLIRDHFKATPADALEEKARTYDKTIKLMFVPAPLKRQ